MHTEAYIGRTNVRALEVIRFYYAPSTRLAQALFWGEYNETFNAGPTGVFQEGVPTNRWGW